MTRLLLALVVATTASSQGDGVIRLKPREFRQLPSAVRRDLDRRRCTIPQTHAKTAAHNVITGSFFGSGSKDWAVLCSVNGSSRILVYRDGGTRRVDSLSTRADATYMVASAGGVTEFSRKIELVGAKSMADEAKAQGISKPPRFDHDGIHDDFVEKGTLAWFFAGRKWMQLEGDD